MIQACLFLLQYKRLDMEGYLYGKLSIILHKFSTYTSGSKWDFIRHLLLENIIYSICLLAFLT